MDDDFAALHRDHRRRLIGALCALGTGVDEATDAVDEAFARAFQRWSRVGARPAPAAWVFVTARNVLRRQHRRRSLERRLLRAHHVERVAPPPAGETWLVVAGLPPRQREVVVLRHVAGLTEPASGAARGISRGTVSSTLRDAHRSLAAQLGDDLPTTPGGR